MRRRFTYHVTFGSPDAWVLTTASLRIGGPTERARRKLLADRMRARLARDQRIVGVRRI